MRVEVSAPGKLVLFGEYAVLEGAPALVTAIDRRVRVTLEEAETWGLVSRPLLGQEVRFSLVPGQGIRWLAIDRVHGERLAYVHRLLSLLCREGWLGPDTPPARLTLDSRGFHAPGGEKLGLGSSAALSVALTTALGVLGPGRPSWSRLWQWHRDLQGGHGSGLDVATSLRGGTLNYRMATGRSLPRATRIALPPGIRLRCFWSGQPASTGALLARLAAWRETAPLVFARLMARLEATARAGMRALEAADLQALLEATAAYGDDLRALSEAAALDSYCARHRRLAALAKRAGVVFKPSGAGGGDIGVALSDDPERLDYLQRLCESVGFVGLDLQMDSRGCEVRAIDATNQEGEGHGTLITHT